LPHFRLARGWKRGKLLPDEADLDAFLAASKVEEGAAPDLRHISRK
jgi:hypothetical protein